jgi:hypothetical protein
MQPTILAVFFKFSTASSMSAAGLALLVIGLLAAKDEIIRARGIDKVVAQTHLCFAIPLAAFGAEHGCWGSMERKTGLRQPELCRFRYPASGVRQVTDKPTYRELGQGHVPREGQTLRRKQGLSRGRPQGLLSQSFSAAVRQASCENWVP